MSIVVWSASKWGTKVIRHEFDRETGSFYFRKDQFGREYRERKEGGYDRYFPSEQEAMNFIAARDAARKEREAAEKEKRLLNDAAPELLSVAIKAEALISGDFVGAEWKRACSEFVREARATIAKARGDQ